MAYPYESSPTTLKFGFSGPAPEAQISGRITLRGERQGGRGQTLSGLQGQQICTFLIGVGNNQRSRTGL